MIGSITGFITIVVVINGLDILLTDFLISYLIPFLRLGPTNHNIVDEGDTNAN